MSASNKSIEDLRAFIAFLQSLWGILAGISVVFPLSNVFIKVIPLKAYGEERGVFDALSPSLITAVATLVTLFVILGTFNNRDTFEKQKRQEIQRVAWISFAIGMLALVIYLVIHVAYLEYAWEPWGWGSGDPRKLFAEIPLMVAYSAFFALITRAFMLLGMIEFFEHEK